jgi:hypothetical protein
MNSPLLATQFIPPSFEYSNGASPPDAAIVIFPLLEPQSVGSVVATVIMLGELGCVKITGLLVLATEQEPKYYKSLRLSY